jgi:hypothetical protein
MVLINLDLLYDDTLYDFSGCFKQWALNKYLMSNLQGSVADYWNHHRSEFGKFNFQRHTVSEGSTVQGEVDRYLAFCKELLFDSKDHAYFYGTLLAFAVQVENFCKNSGKPSRFPPQACLEIARSFLNEVDFEGDLGERVNVLRKKIESNPNTPALLVLDTDLKKILGELGSAGITDRGFGMMEYRTNQTKAKLPVANIIIHDIFQQFLADFPDTAWVTEPAKAQKDYPAKFQGLTLKGFVTNPMSISITFEETRPNRRQFTRPLPEDFPACRPDMVPPLDVDPTVVQLRQHIYATLYVNDCLNKFRGHGVDLRRCASLRDIVLDIPRNGGEDAFWSVQYTDFNSKITKRDRPMGVWLPADVADQLQLTDQSILSGGKGIGVAPKRKSALATGIRVEKTKDNVVRFSDKEDVILIPTEKLSLSTTEPTTTADPPDPKETEDNKNLTYIIGGVVGFFGLFLILNN